MSWYNKYIILTTDNKWRDLLREVYKYASENSNDISTFTAAMLVNDELENLVIASNGFPPEQKKLMVGIRNPEKIK